jgi:CubicO group peptidase (beta-lactamase class C family)
MNNGSRQRRLRTVLRRLAFLLAGALLAGGMTELYLARRGPAFPGRRWERLSPWRAGFSRKKLVELAWKAGGTGCIVQGGRMVFEWGEPAAQHDAASSTKPFYTFLAFQALAQGRMQSLDDRAAAWLPELGGLNAALDYKDQDIRFRHLLSQTSGYGLEEKPGEAFAYNDYATGLLGFLLYHRVFAMPPGEDNALLNGELLGRAIGFEHGTVVTHKRSRPGRIRISARDQARFALLYLRGGSWAGRPVIAPELFAEQMAYRIPPEVPRTAGREVEILEEAESYGGGRDLKNHLGCLGYYWWFNRTTPDGTRLLPDAPPGTFMGSGYGGRYAMIVMPEEDLVVVWHDIYNGEDWAPLSENGRFKVNEVVRELRQARTGAEP